MKHFLTLSLFACSLVGYTQVSPSFNPDYNGDGFVGVDDILGVLSHYDTPWEAGQAENMVVDSLETIIAELSLTVDSIQSELEEAEQTGCFSPLYPLASWWEEWGSDWQNQLYDTYEDIEAIRSGYLSFCSLASWQSPIDSECFTNPETGVMNCYWPDVIYDSQMVLDDLQWFVNQEDAYGYAVPQPACLLAIHNTLGPLSCDEWNITNQASGVGGSAAMQVPSGSGALLVRASGVNRTYNISIPSSMGHVFWLVSGVNCTWNISYNPSNTTIGVGPSGIDMTVNFIEDTNL